MDNTDDMICARDPEGALIFWNEAFNRMCIRYFDVEASVGLKTVELLLPDQKKSLMKLSKNWRDVFQGNVFELEYDLTLPNSEKRMLATKWTPIKIDKRVVWAAEITRDITESKLAEENLRRSEQQLRLIADSLPVFISYVDHNERYVFNNKSYLDFFNLTIDQIDGKPVKEILGPDTYKHVRPHVKRVLEGEQTWFEVEILRDGINYHLESTYIPDMDPNGVVNGFFVLATDVTERKHREAELQRHREELAHVSRLTTMGELTASLAHELNQPLTAILSNAQAARRFLEHDAVDIEEVKEILDDIIGDDRRAGQVIRRLRGFLKRGEFYLKKWDINEVIQEVVTLVHSDAVIRNVSVHLDIQEELPHVLGDRIQIQQVLLNLIINGLDAMVDVHPESRNIIVKTEYAVKNSVTVSVGDSGTGIQPDQMQQIFEPFHTTKADGMGMGLSINRSIIQAHHGELWAENNQNQGATFFFTLPIASGDNIDGE
jgi:PAS domain S-box-containing protein